MLIESSPRDKLKRERESQNIRSRAHALSPAKPPLYRYNRTEKLKCSCAIEMVTINANQRMCSSTHQRVFPLANGEVMLRTAVLLFDTFENRSFDLSVLHE